MNVEKEFKKIKPIVRRVLRENEESRGCDNLLVKLVVERLGFEWDFGDVRKFPSFETITRCRRTIQNTDGEFKADEEVEEVREIRREEFRQINMNSQYY